MADIEIRLKSLVKEPFFHVPWKVQYTCERIAARLSRTLNLRPCNVTKENIRDLFRKVDREDWYDIIGSLIWTERGDHCYILSGPTEYEDYGEFERLPFIKEDLKKDYYNIKPGDIVTHRKVGGIFVVNNYVPFDKRREEEYRAKDNMKDYAFCLAEFGNMVYCDGLNNKGIPTGFEWGDFTLNDTNSSRYNFIPLDYEPKEGELIYYLRKSILGEIHWKNSWAWDHLGTHKYHINYKADHRKVYESWFKEYD